MFLNSLFSVLKKYFLSGVLVVVPLILTFIVMRFLFESIDGILQPLLYKALGYSVFGMGFLVTIMIILLAGIFTRNIIGARLYRLGDTIMEKMPIIRPIYSSAKQLIEAVTLPSMKSFKEVALVEYPRKGVYALSFISNRLDIETESGKQVYYSVFVPSTPTPVSGMVIMVPVEDVISLEMTVEEGIKFLVSGGVASPETLKRKKITVDTESNMKVSK